MAKINDLKRAIVFNEVRYIRSIDGCCLLDDPRAFSSLKIKFGRENRKGMGSVNVRIKLYMLSRMYTFTFDGYFNHVDNDVIYKCITIESDFSCARLYHINNYKFNGLWQEDEEDAAAVPAITSVEEESDFEVKRISAVK